MSNTRASVGNTRNQATHCAVLDAAEALLAEQGYAGVSMEAVARRAGAGKPTLYRWWPSKAALLMEVYERRKTATLAEPPPGASAQADLGAMVASMIRFWQDTPAGQAFRSIVAEAQADPAALALLRQHRPRARTLRLLGRRERQTEVFEVFGYLGLLLLLGGRSGRHLRAPLEHERRVLRSERLSA